MADWTHGFNVAELKAQARPFIEVYRPYSYGAFGIPKENVIAQARHDAQYAECALGTGPDPVIGAIIVEVLERKRTVRDWSVSRVAEMQPGDVFVHDLWVRAGREERFVKWMLGKQVAAGRRLWVETHVENAAVVRMLLELGFRSALVKVMASSDLKGLYVSDSRAIARPPLAAVDALTLGLVAERFCTRAELAAIRAELAAFSPWAQHYSSYNKRQSWTAFALSGYYPKDPSNIVKPAEMAQGWKKEHEADLSLRPAWTVAAKKFPATMRMLERIPGAKDRVRFSRVAGGGELSRHADITDREAGTANGKVARLHIPIWTNPGALFHGWNEAGEKLSAHMREGWLYYIDQRKPHGVTNGDAGKERIHIMCDVFCDDATRALLLRARDIGEAQ